MKYIFILAKVLTFSRGYFRNIITLRHQVDIVWGLALKSLECFCGSHRENKHDSDMYFRRYGGWSVCLSVSLCVSLFLSSLFPCLPPHLSFFPFFFSPFLLTLLFSFPPSISFPLDVYHIQRFDNKGQSNIAES